jgi:hypothetical protein
MCGSMEPETEVHARVRQAEHPSGCGMPACGFPLRGFLAERTEAVSWMILQKTNFNVIENV